MWSKSAIYSLILVTVAVALPILGLLSFPGPDSAVNTVGLSAVVLLLLGFILSIIGIRNTKKFSLRGHVLAIVALIIPLIVGGLFLWEWLSG